MSRSRSTNLKAERTYSPFPKALKALEERLDATPYELAAWIFLGPNQGGLIAYRNANEIKPPPRFHFDSYMGEDYLDAMMVCWFEDKEIQAFAPADRFLTGSELIRRWESRPGVQAVGYICAKIAESRLQDLHPTYGITQGSDPDDEGLPALSDALFARREIEAIEAEDFGVFHDAQGDQSNPELQPGTPAWFSVTRKAAADAKHARPGGSRDKREQLLTIWRIGKYDTKTRCAEEESGAIGIAYSTALKILRNVPKPT